MGTEKQEEFQEVEWTIVIQCVKEGNNPPTGRERLIRSHSSARFCFELSRNLN